MENSHTEMGHSLDKLKCWSLFYIDEQDNVMHDFGWKDDNDTLTLAQLLLAIKYTNIISQSLQSAYLEYLENSSEDAQSISDIIRYMEAATTSEQEDSDFVSPLFLDSQEDSYE